MIAAREMIVRNNYIAPKRQKLLVKASFSTQTFSINSPWGKMKNEENFFFWNAYFPGFLKASFWKLWKALEGWIAPKMGAGVFGHPVFYWTVISLHIWKVHIIFQHIHHLHQYTSLPYWPKLWKWMKIHLWKAYFTCALNCPQVSKVRFIFHVLKTKGLILAKSY